MANFNESIEIILRHEGGLADHPNDPGGLTNFGISQRSYPNLDIRNLTKEDAKAIYRRDFWNKIRGDEIINQQVANQVLDFAVNSGPAQAGRSLQRVINRVTRIDPPLTVDGVIGTKTITALNQSNPARINNELVQERLSFYDTIIQKNPALSVFKNGWYRRATSFLWSPDSGNNILKIVGFSLILFLILR